MTNGFHKLQYSFHEVRAALRLLQAVLILLPVHPTPQNLAADPQTKKNLKIK
jgi:hypothetical protein